jgi:hypothetical protein
VLLTVLEMATLPIVSKPSLPVSFLVFSSEIWPNQQGWKRPFPEDLLGSKQRWVKSGLKHDNRNRRGCVD